ncbi:MAG: thiamine pyrophosphate-dependent enzyme [Stellaceae bacterium]
MMHTADMLKAFATYREDAIVVPGRGGRYWTDLTTRPNLDVPVGDPAMGGHAGFALGLALARPEKKVILFDSEGDILMSLGMLVTIAEQQPENFYHFLIDNGCYATTGGQPVPMPKTPTTMRSHAAPAIPELSRSGNSRNSPPPCPTSSARLARCLSRQRWLRKSKMPRSAGAAAGRPARATK